jgi:hypothetical protein
LRLWAGFPRGTGEEGGPLVFTSCGLGGMFVVLGNFNIGWGFCGG